ARAWHPRGRGAHAAGAGVPGRGCGRDRGRADRRSAGGPHPRLADGQGVAMVTTASAELTAPYDVEAIRRDFPILAREVYGKPLTYLDNGASAQKPQAVIDAIARAYGQEYANV